MKLNVVGSVRLRSVHRSTLVPLPVFLRHDALVHDTVVVELSRARLVLGDLFTHDESHEGGKGVSVFHGGGRAAGATCRSWTRELGYIVVEGVLEPEEAKHLGKTEVDGNALAF